MKKSRSKYTLGDGVKMNAQHPETFWIPSAYEKARVKVGDVVKLVFIPTDDADDGCAERMWVLVTEIDGDKMVGQLDNQPFLMDYCLGVGDIIKFRAEHIIAIADEPGQPGCLDCGSATVTAKAGDGWLCLECLDRRNSLLDMIADHSGAVVQPIDQDGPPVPCGHEGCDRDAIEVVRLTSGGRQINVTACAIHMECAHKVVANALIPAGQESA